MYECVQFVASQYLSQTNFFFLPSFINQQLAKKKEEWETSVKNGRRKKAAETSFFLFLPLFPILFLSPPSSSSSKHGCQALKIPTKAIATLTQLTRKESVSVSNFSLLFFSQSLYRVTFVDIEMKKKRPILNYFFFKAEQLRHTQTTFLSASAFSYIWFLQCVFAFCFRRKKLFLFQRYINFNAILKKIGVTTFFLKNTFVLS